MNWFTLTLIYLAFMTSASLVNKKSVNNDDVDEIVFGALVQVATSVVSLGLAIVTGWKFVFDATSIPLFIGMGVTYFIAVSLYFIGLKRVDLSTTAILESSGAIHSLILGLLFLGEVLTGSKVIGVLLIIISIIVISAKDKRESFNKYSVMILVAIFFYALGAVFDKQLNEFGTPLSYLALSFGTAGFSMLLVFHKRARKAVSTFKKKHFWQGIATNGILYSLGFWSLFEAYNRGGEVSRMFPITLSMSVLIPILGIIFLKERDNMTNKLIALPIMIGGLWLLGS